MYLSSLYCLDFSKFVSWQTVSSRTETVESLTTARSGRTEGSNSTPINDLIYRALSKAGFPTINESQGFLRSDGKRSDGITLIPWKAGKSLVWDATVIDTLAPSYLTATTTHSGT